MREYQGGTKTQVQGLGLLWTLPLGWTPWRTHSPDSNKICLPSLLTCYLHKSRISDVTFGFTLHESEGMCVSLLLLLYLCYLPVPRTPCTSQLHCCFRTYAIFTNIFHKEVMVYPKCCQTLSHICWVVASFLFIVQERRNISIGNIISFVCFLGSLVTWGTWAWTQGPPL
jgi:hypothetical protein